MYTASVLKAMLGEATTGVIPAEFLTTNRIMERWAVANGSGLASERWDDDPRRSRVPPLDDDSFLVVEKIVQHSPPRTHRIVTGWYMRPVPTIELARELSMKPRSLEKGLLVCLGFLQLKFERSGHLTLLKLLRVRV